MNIILKTANENGSYSNMQSWDNLPIPENHALWPDNLDTADFYKHNGFVVLTIETIDKVDTVTSYVPNVEAWEAWKASLPEPVEPDPVEDVTWEAMAVAITEGVNEV